MFKRFNFNLIFRHLRHLIHFIVKLKGKFLFGSTVNVSESIFRTNISLSMAGIYEIDFYVLMFCSDRMKCVKSQDYILVQYENLFFVKNYSINLNTIEEENKWMKKKLRFEINELRSPNLIVKKI